MASPTGRRGAGSPPPHALESLPLISEAFCRGELGIDKVVELTRFATPETEERLIAWAEGVSCGRIRHKGDLATCSIDEAREAEHARSLSWWYFDENARFGLQAELPADEGSVVAIDALIKDERGGEIEGGPAIHAETVRRLLCHSRSQALVEDIAGDPVGVGRMSRQPSAWMLRQLRHRDGGVCLPGVRHVAVHSSPSHRLVGARGAHRSRQHVARVHVPSQARARVWLDD